MTDAQINKAVHKMVNEVANITDDPRSMLCIILGMLSHFTRSFEISDADAISILADHYKKNEVSISTERAVH